jgi:hypothetical protein
LALRIPRTKGGLYLQQGRGRGWADRIKHGFQVDFEGSR